MRRYKEIPGMGNMSEYQPQLEQALSHLHSEDAQKALKTFHPILSYPGLVEQPAEFSETLQALAEISMYIGEPQFASRLCSASHTPTDVNQLHRVGFEMINHGLSDMAATVLAYAHRQNPDNPEVLHELSASLGNGMRYAEAHRFLQDAALAEENILALSCEEGQRQKLWAGSPVPSNFFS
jgi:hypothetical protein